VLRPGQSEVATQRQEKDKVVIQSGVEMGKTLGTPIALFVANQDQRPGDYAAIRDIPRPSHADYTYQKKYGIKASSGGGRASARETIGRVCAGAIAEKFLREEFGLDIVAWVSAIYDIQSPEPDILSITRAEVDATPVRCPDAKSAAMMQETILRIKNDNDSIGGVITCVCRDVPAGLGEPVFDKLEALLTYRLFKM